MRKEIIWILLVSIIFLFTGIVGICGEEVSFTLGGEKYSKNIPLDPIEKDKLIHDLAKLISTYDDTFGTTEQEVSNSLNGFSIELDKTQHMIGNLIIEVQEWEPKDFDYKEIEDNINALAGINSNPYRVGIGGSVIIDSSGSGSSYGGGLNVHFQLGGFYLATLFGFTLNAGELNSLTTIGFGVLFD